MVEDLEPLHELLERQTLTREDFCLYLRRIPLELLSALRVDENGIHAFLTRKCRSLNRIFGFSLLEALCDERPDVPLDPRSFNLVISLRYCACGKCIRAIAHHPKLTLGNAWLGSNPDGFSAVWKKIALLQLPRVWVDLDLDVFHGVVDFSKIRWLHGFHCNFHDENTEDNALYRGVKYSLFENASITLVKEDLVPSWLVEIAHRNIDGKQRSHQSILYLIWYLQKRFYKDIAFYIGRFVWNWTKYTRVWWK